jgi:amino-acid N-acetyltransferase
MSSLIAVPSSHHQSPSMLPVITQPASPIVIRSAAEADVPALTALVAEYVRTGDLLPRSAGEIRATLATWRIVETDGTLIGCGSLRRMSHERMELRSLAVVSQWRGLGVGARLVRDLIHRAWQAGATVVFALTRAVPFFLRLGFQLTERAQLPEKVMHDCAACPLRFCCDETAVWLRHASA